MAFFGRPLPFRALLDSLERRCQCTVTLQDSGGIPDPRGEVTGELYYVERLKEDQVRFAFIEVFQMDVIVLPDLLRSICQQLDVDEGELRERLQ